MSAPDSGPSSLFWKTDEDGERVHRLQLEWDGNKGAWREWTRYRSEADHTTVSVEATWSRWGLGAEYEWSYGWTLDGQQTNYVSRIGTIMVGPWCLMLWRTRPSTSARSAS